MRIPTLVPMAALCILIGCGRQTQDQGGPERGNSPAPEPPIPSDPTDSGTRRPSPKLPEKPEIPSGEEERILLLIETFKGKDLEKRFKACEELVDAGKPAVWFLIAALKDENCLVRVHAANALKAMGERPTLLPHVREVATPHLIASIRDRDCYVPVIAVQALGIIGDERAVEPLIEALLDFRSRVRGFAAISLGRLTGRDFGEDHEAWRKWYQSRS